MRRLWTALGRSAIAKKKESDICIGVGEDIENENVTHEKIKKRKTLKCPKAF
jgi:hypothetical protein